MSFPAFIGRYAVEREIASGGFAAVVLARDEELEVPVTLKILHANLASNDKVITHFLEEARLLRRIRSPRVVSVHDVGRLEDGRPYFVMDYADRGTLADRLKRLQPTIIAQRDGVGVLIDALADGLTAVHEANVVHRDVKPANVLLQRIKRQRENETEESFTSLVEPDERVFLADLGIAKDMAIGVTGATMMAGTPLYQAPEQVESGQPVTPMTDIYSATALMWHVLTGRAPPPFHRVAEHLPGLPEMWRDCIEHGMAMDPEARFQEMVSWRSAMNDALDRDRREAASEAVTQISEGGIECPYKGLVAFQTEDAGYFFGREDLVEELVSRLQQSRILVLGGSSGSGKSSVLRAGLLPALTANAIPGSDSWRVCVFTPGRDPMTDLYFHLIGDNSNLTAQVSLDDFIAYPSAARRLATANEGELLICIDQFEELFTLVTRERRNKFIEALSAMTDPADSRVRIVITIRADFYASCAEIPWLADRISENQLLVGPMTRPELRRAISEPARAAGLHMDRSLIDAIVDEAGKEAGSLPLVAHSLYETCIRRKGATMSLDCYREVGGVTGAISQTAETLFSNSFDDRQQKATQRLFLRLVTPGEGTPDTRRLLPIDEVEQDVEPDTTQRVVEALTDARLLTVDENNVQIAHEALLRTWPRLTSWIEDSRDDLRMRQRIQHDAAEWENDNREPDLLYRGTRLLAAEEWSAENENVLGKLEREFLIQARDARESALAASDRRRRRRRLFYQVAAGALAALTIGATGASILAIRASNLAESNRQIAVAATAEANERFARALGAAANGLSQSDPLLALSLSAESITRANSASSTSEARSAMLLARQKLTEPGLIPLGSPLTVGDAQTMDLDAAGLRVAVGLRDGRIVIYSTKTDEGVLAELVGHSGGIRDLAFSPDGNFLLSAATDGDVRLWDVGPSRYGPVTTLFSGDDVAFGVAFDSVGKRAASATGDGTVRLWDISTGMQIGPPLAEEQLGFKRVAFSPVLEGLVAGNVDGAIYGWMDSDARSAFPPIPGGPLGPDPDHISFSSDGSVFAVSHTNGKVSTIGFPAGVPIVERFSNTEAVVAAAFASPENILVGATANGTLLLEDSNLLPVGGIVQAHGQSIVDIESATQVPILATLGRDQQVRLWQIASTPSNGETLAFEDGVKALGVAYSPDGNEVAVGDSEGNIWIWDVGSAMKPLLLKGHRNQVWAVAYSQDGRNLVTGDRDGNIRIWDTNTKQIEDQFDLGQAPVWNIAPTASKLFFVATGNGVHRIDASNTSVVQTIGLPDTAINRVTVSPDETRLAAASSDGRIYVWNIAENRLERAIEADDNTLWSVAFSTDSSRIASASSDEVVKVWDLENGEELASYGGLKGGATDIAFLADEATLVATDRSGELHWWDTAVNRRLMPVQKVHAGPSWRIALAPDGQSFATTGEDGLTRIWDSLDLEKACSLGSPAFDKERRNQYLGSEEPTTSCSAIQ
ncbi:WD40 repeat domain-containing serine/threonine protein kinase [Ruegeria arenilitoris]|uniref:WD40 repeat domain-containing serine/threonine protein kinase n=1 Tax=Ruegeria arenilitoris TaxID=1173585 RepID=UPI00148059CF